MAALPYPVYGVEHLYLFPVFQTREAYQAATGMEAPPFDPTRDFKSWFDPKAMANPRRKIVYDNVIAYAADGSPLVGTDGKPMLEPLVVDRDEAAAVNIPVKGVDVIDQRGTGHEVPVPVRLPEPDEELIIRFGGLIAVRNKTMTEEKESGFSAADRALLHAIAEKIGIAG